MMSPSLSLLLMLVAAAVFQLADAAKPPKTAVKAIKDVEAVSGRSLPPADGWIIMMHRINPFTVDFNRSWSDYKYGFGELGSEKELWLGNEVLYMLTNGRNHKLRVEMITEKRETFYAEYEFFSIGSEEEKYVLHASGYDGDAGDSLTNVTMGSHAGMNFSTPDADNGIVRLPNYSCSSVFGAGWWFNSCLVACLTCQKGGNFYWESLPADSTLREVRMMIRPNYDALK